ncbi:phage protease [Campylobacter jejuni]
MRDLLLELNTKLTNEKVKISPIGIAKGLDGRVFKIDGEKLINNIQKNGLDIALNLNHQGGEAYGFDRNSLELREDGIYASLELTPKGKELVENKAFRYLSPEYYVDDDKNVIHLDAMGLVNQPNLLNRALNKAMSLINSTKNSKLSTPRSGTEAKKGKVGRGLQVGAGSETPARKDEFNSSAKLKKRKEYNERRRIRRITKIS